jgi:hypothetical protein
LRGGFVGCVTSRMLVNPGNVGLALDGQLDLRWRFLIFFPDNFLACRSGLGKRRNIPWGEMKAPKLDLSSGRKPGPITTDRRSLRKIDEELVKAEHPEAMGPGSALGFASLSGTTSVILAAQIASELSGKPPSIEERAQGMPGALAGTRSLACN